jgi:hypothetical protein
VHLPCGALGYDKDVAGELVDSIEVVVEALATVPRTDPH